jgi:hypothetical protein
MAASTIDLIRNHMQEIVDEGNPLAYRELFGDDLFRDILRQMIEVAYEDVGYAYYVADALNANFPNALLDNLPKISKNLRQESLLFKISDLIAKVMNGTVDIQKVEEAIEIFDL